jgi:hypothetical protein
MNVSVSCPRRGEGPWSINVNQIAGTMRAQYKSYFKIATHAIPDGRYIIKSLAGYEFTIHWFSMVQSLIISQIRFGLDHHITGQKTVAFRQIVHSQ